jgi:Xaa-Pro aminopeptidase
LLTKERVKILRGFMEEKGIDAYIIPSSDAHQSEYVADYFKSRQWISGFTGSAGTVVITQGDAGLWTDGRYYIQAENQLRDSGIRLFKAAEVGVPSYIQWLCDTLTAGSSIGFDGTVFPVNLVKEMKEAFKDKGITLEENYDLVNMIWSDRPEIPKNPIFIHEDKFAGKSRAVKLEQVREKISSLGGTGYLLSTLDDIAWLLNIRGSDVPNNPVVISFAYISQTECYLFVDPAKVSIEVKTILEKDGVNIMLYNGINKFLKERSINDKIILDINKTNICLYNAINSEAKILEYPNITSVLKAIKNEVEIENLKQCQVNDGVAMVKVIKWIKESIGKEELTELTVESKLLKCRQELEHFVSTSFDSIIGYKANAAMMHYKAVSGKEATLQKSGLLLMDSGGQYYTGTTDITRTIALGALSDEEKTDFTLVLKGHIALDRLKFLYGATGSNLDVIARQPIWEHGIDYKCGTGHGVGFFLNVHEGPHRIAPIINDVKLEKGMIITNEPGIYREGKHGIRTENMMVVVEAEKTEFGQFMRFEAITCCPIELEAIKAEMLNDEEKKWLNNYHQQVYNKLSPKLNESEKTWLKEATKPI